MKIAFVTTQSAVGSTVMGRIVPLALFISKHHEVHLFIHTTPGITLISLPTLQVHIIGNNPFVLSLTGKKRMRGGKLLMRIMQNVFGTVVALTRVDPHAVVIAKPLPQNVLAVRLWSQFQKKRTIVLDVDDFELSANVLRSLTQRAAIHWSERQGSVLANRIIAATPFLADHFEQLTQRKKHIEIIPTGIPTVASVGLRKLTTGISLLYVGSTTIASGHRVDLLPKILERIAQLYPDTMLTIAGGGDDSELLKQQFAARGVKNNVIWYGRFTIHDVQKLLHKADIILDPIDAGIANRAKSSFRTSLAAMAGIPLVTSDIGIRPYLVPQQLHSHFFAAPGDYKSYTEKILAFREQPLTSDQRRTMIQHIQQYTWQRLSQQYMALIQEKSI